MAITEQEIARIRAAIDAAARPLFFFDDDPDGTTSFLQLLKYKGDGKGVAVKANPTLEAKYLRKIEENAPDLVVILDKPIVEPEFFEGCKVPVVWIDHHQPQDVKPYKHVSYYNPRIHDDKDNKPTTYWAYKVAGGPLWLASVGSVADWHLPDYLERFRDEYPGYLPATFKRVEDVLFNSKLGRLARVISFNLKGTVTDTMKSVMTLAKVEHPDEIMEQTTARGKFLYKQYAQHAARYENLLQRAKACYAAGDPILLFVYEDDQTSMTSDLSNELLYLFPEQLVVIARRHTGEFKYSFRSAGKYQIPPILKQALEGVDGYGGGHTYACGGCVHERDNERFLQQLRAAIAAAKHS